MQLTSTQKPYMNPGLRRGVVVVAAVVAFAIAATFLFYLLKNTLDQQRQMLTHRQEIQADWLAAAGIDRALAKLKQSPDYNGETWRVPADELSDTAAAEVVIQIEDSNLFNQRKITAQANYPLDTPHRARKTLAKTITLP
jgi:type II secretory pathway component PulK